MNSSPQLTLVSFTVAKMTCTKYNDLNKNLVLSKDCRNQILEKKDKNLKLGEITTLNISKI